MEGLDVEMVSCDGDGGMLPLEERSLTPRTAHNMEEEDDDQVMCAARFRVGCLSWSSRSRRKAHPLHANQIVQIVEQAGLFGLGH